MALVGLVGLDPDHLLKGQVHPKEFSEQVVKADPVRQFESTANQPLLIPELQIRANKFQLKQSPASAGPPPGSPHWLLEQILHLLDIAVLHPAELEPQPCHLPTKPALEPQMALIALVDQQGQLDLVWLLI